MRARGTIAVLTLAAAALAAASAAQAQPRAGGHNSASRFALSDLAPASGQLRHRFFSVVDRSQMRRPNAPSGLRSASSPGGGIKQFPHAHRPADVTLKRGIVGADRHPDFLWAPVR